MIETCLQKCSESYFHVCKSSNLFPLLLVLYNTYAPSQTERLLISPSPTFDTESLPLFTILSMKFLRILSNTQKDFSFTDAVKLKKNKNFLLSNETWKMTLSRYISSWEINSLQHTEQ